MIKLNQMKRMRGLAAFFKLTSSTHKMNWAYPTAPVAHIGHLLKKT